MAPRLCRVGIHIVQGVREEQSGAAAAENILDLVANVLEIAAPVQRGVADEKKVGHETVRYTCNTKRYTCILGPWQARGARRPGWYCYSAFPGHKLAGG